MFKTKITKEKIILSNQDNLLYFYSAVDSQITDCTLYLPPCYPGKCFKYLVLNPINFTIRTNSEAKFLFRNNEFNQLLINADKDLMGSELSISSFQEFWVVRFSSLVDSTDKLLFSIWT